MPSNEIIFQHPELSKNEVFFINANTEGFLMMEFRTKRRGVQAYDGCGNKLLSADWFPVFLQLSELKKLNLSLSDIRRQANSL